MRSKGRINLHFNMHKQLTSDCRFKQKSKELWVSLRTPQQFALWYPIMSNVAALAASKIVPEHDVPGLQQFKEKVRIPNLHLSVDESTLHLSGSSKDIYPLLPFLADPDFFGFSRVDASSYQLELEDAKAAQQSVQDLKELCNLYGWLIDVE